MAKLDLSILNKKFHRLTIKKCLGKYKGSNGRDFYKWLCRCDCGKSKIINHITHVKSGNTKSCGCLKREWGLKSIERIIHRTNLIGKCFFRIKVLKKVSTPKHIKSDQHRDFWLCQCRCGNKCIIGGYNLKTGKTKSCGCWKKDVLKGNQFNKDLSITDEERIKKRYGIKNKAWRNKIYKRDNYVCQKCFKNSCSLVAHHLDGYHWCKGKRYWLINGITLCRKCHRSFHLKYGTYYNTKSQFLEWKNEN